MPPTLMIDIDVIAKKLHHLSQQSGYNIQQQHGQRIFGGPPPDWTGPPPERGTEVYCYRIPRDCFEDELVPVFESVGKLYELRLMIEFSGANRSYGYVRYCNVEDAKMAIKKLHNYHIRPGYPLAVTPSVDNRKLCVKTVPPLRPGVSESDTAQEVSKLVEGVADVKFIARRWLQLEFESHRYAALARRMLVPGNQVIFGNVEIKQVDWADPKDEVYQGKEVAGAGEEKIICVRNVGVGVTEETVRHWFNILTEGQVDNVVMSSGSVLITFLSSAAAMTAMEKGNHLDIGGGTRLSLSWWQQQPSGYSSASARQGAGESSWLASLVTEPPPPPGYGDPLEQMYSVCVGQGWGPPQYRCSTSPDLLGQAVHLYQVAVPRVSATWIPGSPNTDRHLALISCAQAGLHAIAVNSRASLQNYPTAPPPYYRTPPPAPSMTSVQEPPVTRTRAGVATLARPTKESTNLLADTGAETVASSMENLSLKPVLAVPPNRKLTRFRLNEDNFDK